MQHHLGTNLFKGGVDDPTKTVETFSCGKDRHLAPMEVYAPDHFSGDLMGDLSSRRGRIEGSESRGHNVIVKA